MELTSLPPPPPPPDSTSPPILVSGPRHRARGRLPRSAARRGELPHSARSAATCAHVRQGSIASDFEPHYQNPQQFSHEAATPSMFAPPPFSKEKKGKVARRQERTPFDAHAHAMRLQWLGGAGRHGGGLHRGARTGLPAPSSGMGRSVERIMLETPILSTPPSIFTATGSASMIPRRSMISCLRCNSASFDVEVRCTCASCSEPATKTEQTRARLCCGVRARAVRALDG